MENFKQIAEDCLSGKLSGTFILRDYSKVNSNHLKKLNPSKHLMCSYSLGECWISDNGNAYGETGYLHKVSIINFIPDLKKVQIELTISEYELLMESLESYVAAYEASMNDFNYTTNKLKIYRIIDNLKNLNN